MTSKPVDRSGMIKVDEIVDEDPEEARLLRERAKEAQTFLTSFKWCRSVKQEWFAGGFSQIAVFYFEIENSRHPRDKNLWVIVGDLPPAYLVVDVIPDYKEALLVYVYEMRQWVAAVKSGRSVKDCIPVNVDPNIEHALMLESRLDFIEKEYVPSLPQFAGQQTCLDWDEIAKAHLSCGQLDWRNKITAICPKCRTIRPADTSAPDWQCPACGVAYAKAGGAAASASAPTRATTTSGGYSLPWKKLIAIFFIASGVVAGYKNFKARSGGELGSIASHIGSSVNTEQIAALAASSKAEDVMFYTAPWCPYCAQAKTWLAQSGFKYEECDIEARSECASELRALGSDGVPYLIVKGHHMKDGFDSDEFVAALAQKQ